MLCRKTTALTARLALADEGYALPQKKGSVTFKLRVLDLCFPRGAQHRSRSSCIHRLLVLVSELYHAATHSYPSGRTGG